MNEAYIIAWNEIETIHLTIKHYQQFCDKITIFDNFSNDGTFEKAMELGCEVKRFGIEGVLDDTEYLRIKNHCWRGSKADWVIVCDSDEILLTDKEELTRLKGNTLIETEGFDMFSYNMPEESFLEIKTGTPSVSYSKNVIFSPTLVSINYVYGCHVSKPKGNIVIPPVKIPLLHYRNIGGPERLIKRHEQYRARMSAKNKRMGLGCHYDFTDERRIKDWGDGFKNSINISRMDKLAI